MAGTGSVAASILLCLLVAINRPDGSEAVYSMSETCAYIPKGYIGDPNNCQNWGYCEKGQLIATGTCNPGLLFDSKISMCNYASEVQCQTSVENACQFATEPGYVADPNNCNRYCWCSNGVTTCYTCPVNQVFNPAIDECVWSKNYACPTDSICRLVANNVFAGDPNVCGNYIRCQEGSGVSQQCSNKNNKYNPLTGKCSTYNCGSNNPETGVIPQTNTEACKAFVAGGKAEQYFTDGLTCYGYYVCTTTSGPGQWGSCPFATHFNPTKQQCQSPYTVDCKYDRCGNLNLQFVAELGCANYSVCSNQKTVSTGSCADVNPTFQWYDEYAGRCSNVKPDQTICEATPST